MYDILSQISRIKNNVSSAYAAVANKGGSIPATQNTENLPSAIDSIAFPEGIYIELLGSIPMSSSIDANAINVNITLSEITGSHYYFSNFYERYGGGSVQKIVYKLRCQNLVSVPEDFGWYLGTVGNYIFPKCKTIGSGAFTQNGTQFQMWWSGFEERSVYFPECEEIKDNAFNMNRNQTHMSFPKCTIVGSQAFAYCTGLITADFQECIQTGTSAFYGCFSLTNINFPKLKSIPGRCFQDCSNLRSIYFPECEFVGEDAFRMCTNIETINLPKCSLILSGAFTNASKLKSLSLPLCNSLKMNALPISAASELTELVLPELTYMGTNRFSGWVGLSLVDLPKCSVIENSMTRFQSLSNLETVNLPVFSSRIYTEMFANCSKLKSININSVTGYIGSRAFLNCVSLSSISIPKCKAMYERAFEGCMNLSKIYVPSLYFIGDNSSVFKNCTSLRDFWVLSAFDCGSNSTYFEGCSNLVSMYFKLPYGASLIRPTIFTGTGITSSTGSIFVPESLVSFYKSSSYLSNFSNRIFPYNFD